MAVLPKPVVLLTSASSPRKVLKLTVSQPSWQVARACGTVTERNARTMENNRIVVFMVLFTQKLGPFVEIKDSKRINTNDCGTAETWLQAAKLVQSKRGYKPPVPIQ